MPKNIVICCDGTGNEYGNTNSNVVNLYKALIIDGTTQVGYYHPGVGTEGSPTSHGPLGELWSKVMGLAFGGGLLRYIGDAYRFLMDRYQEGDRVYIFGFSRGAYTARALAGVLHMYGLLCPGNDGLIPYILRMYAKKTRDAGGMQETFDIADGFKATFCRPCPLHVVGVWDTVSSVGWIWNPLQLSYTARNPDMANGIHAISIDEKRCYFRNNLWGAPFPGQQILQVWFAGVHSDIGGGYQAKEAGLSQITLQWMLCESMKCGLLVDPDRANHVLGRVPPHPPVPPSVLQCLHQSLHGFWWWLIEFLPHQYYDPISKKKKWSIPMGSSRTIPPASRFHESVVEKLALDPTYKPNNLPPDWKEHLVPTEECKFLPAP